MKTKIKISVIALLGISLGINAQNETVNGDLRVTGYIDATGNYKRIYLGGVGGSTFGIAYSSTFPNYGIFYTEGSPDFVSISPNGNSSNGVMNIYGNGNVGIGTTSPVAKLDIRGHVKVTGNLDMTGSNKRIYLGGVGGSTFGIAYSSTFPNYGIFYTEGSPDFVSISPNGNSSNGVMNIYGNGNVGIGTTDTKGFKLGVNGKIAATEVKIAEYSNWSDYVFDKNYNLPTLEEVESHIKEKGHLKGIPNAEEVKKEGFFLGEMDARLLQKIEELMLYTIEQEKEINNLKEENKLLKSLNSKLLDLQERLERIEKNGL